MTINPTEPLEIFYSYAHEDEALRKQLEKHLSLLQQRGLVAGWHDREIPAGSEWISEIDAHLNSAHIILLLISADFLASKYCYGVEMKRALERQKAGEARVIPIILRPVDWQQEPSLHKLQALPIGAMPVTDWSGPPTYDEAFQDIAIGIRKVVEDFWKTPSAATMKASPVWNVPYRSNPFFTGREEVLKKLHENLTTTTATALTQAQAINGLGGIGKTQTAVEYAYRHTNEYKYILWVSAATRDVLLASLVELAILLNLPEKEEKVQALVATAVKRWLEQHERWLLIFDNADDLALIEDYLPARGKGHILLTTRAHAVGTLANRIEVQEMDTQEGMLLLLRRARVLAMDVPLERASAQDRDDAREIVKEMDGLPLALDQAGAYIEETGCSVTVYLERYRKRPTQASLLKRRGGTGNEHPEPVAKTWSLSFEQVEHLNKSAADLLRFCAFLSPDTIPEELILEGASLLGPHLQTFADDASLLDEAIGTLLRFSLVRRNREERTLSIHRLVQSVLKDTMNKRTERTWVERTVRAVNHSFAYKDFPIQLYLPHALVCITYIKQWNIASPEAARLLDQVGNYLGLSYSGEEEAEEILKRALTIRENLLGPEHRDTVSSLNNLASLYGVQGRYEEAEVLLKRALAIYERLLGPEHLDTAYSLTKLAALYDKQGLPEQAEPFHQRALAIYKKLEGLFERRSIDPDSAYPLEKTITAIEEDSNGAVAVYQQFARSTLFALGLPAEDTSILGRGTQSDLLMYEENLNGQNKTILPVFTRLDTLKDALLRNTSWQHFLVLQVKGNALLVALNPNVTIVINPWTPSEFRISPGAH